MSQVDDAAPSLGVGVILPANTGAPELKPHWQRLTSPLEQPRVGALHCQDQHATTDVGGAVTPARRAPDLRDVALRQTTLAEPLGPPARTSPSAARCQVEFLVVVAFDACQRRHPYGLTAERARFSPAAFFIRPIDDPANNVPPVKAASEHFLVDDARSLGTHRFRVSGNRPLPFSDRECMRMTRPGMSVYHPSIESDERQARYADHSSSHDKHGTAIGENAREFERTPALLANSLATSSVAVLPRVRLPTESGSAHRLHD